MSNETKQLTPWQKFFDKKYLGSHDFEEGEEKRVTILKAYSKEIEDPTGKVKKSEKIVVEFVQEDGKEKILPLIPGSIVSQSISRLAGSKFIENWAGVNLGLYVNTSVKVSGVKVGGIRVRFESDAEPQKEHLHKDHSGWDKCVKAVANGYTVADIRKKYNIVESVEAELLAAVSGLELGQ